MAEIAESQGTLAERRPGGPTQGKRRWAEPKIALPFKIGAGLAFVVLLVPVVIVVLAGLNSGDILTFPPQGISLRWVIAFLQSDTYLDAYLFSLWLAVLTMAISTVIGTMAAIFLSRVRFPGRDLLRAYFVSPLILPGIVLGLALYVGRHRWGHRYRRGGR